MVLRPATSPRKIKLVDPEPARQDPETHLAGAFTPPGDLLRESVSRDWPLVYSELLAWCPEAEDRQGTPVLAALKTSEEVTSLPVPLRFWAETERSAHGKPLHPETPAGLAEQSLRALRRDGHNIMRCTPLFHRTGIAKTANTDTLLEVCLVGVERSRLLPRELTVLLGSQTNNTTTACIHTRKISAGREGHTGPVPNGTLHVHLWFYELTMAAVCVCPLSPRDRRVSHSSF